MIPRPTMAFDPCVLRRFALRAGACSVALAGLAGCHDSPTDPVATLLTEETVPAVGMSVQLPALPDLAARGGVEAGVAEHVDIWTRSWDAEDGAEDRARAVEAAAPVVAEALGVEGVRSAVGSLSLAVDAVEALGPVPDDLAPALERVKDAWTRARGALEEGRPAEALAGTLHAADGLRALGPEAVGRTLMARAERALAAARADKTLDAVDLDRGERLLRGAEQALLEGDLTRAVQRGYYACQILERPAALR